MRNLDRFQNIVERDPLPDRERMADKADNTAMKDSSDSCITCFGSGVVGSHLFTKWATCPECNGRGKVVV